MKLLRYDASIPAEAELYKWTVCAFNAHNTQGQTPEQTAKNIAILGKLCAASDPEEGEPWPLMDERRALKPGVREIALTAAEHDWLEKSCRNGMTNFRPFIQLRHHDALVRFLADAPTVKADEATARGAAGAPPPRRGPRG